ncbi:MAG: metallophosphoesterase [Clostridiaceae bacterium]|nr:metallophosphoesterase [Clostridiaceae bacterium]
MKRKIVILILLVIAILTTSCATSVKLTEEDKEFITRYYTEYESDLFDAENIVLTFAAMSDTHIGGKNQPEKLAKAIKLLNKRAKYRLDALLFAGDLTDVTGYKVQEDEISIFKKVIEENKDKNTSILYILGNHDVNDEVSMSPSFYRIFGEAFYNANVLEKEEILSGKHHWIVNGYHFLGADFDWSADDYVGKNLEWIDTKLKEITEKEPNKPVFVSVHAPRTNVDRVLSKYPQVILLTGHTHLPLNSDRAIKQTTYTHLHCGGMYYYRQYTVDNKLMDDLGEIHNFMQGYLIDVDKNHNVRVIRMDFYHEKAYEPVWIIPAPIEDKSHLLYTEELKDKSKRPYFEDTEIDLSDSMTYTFVGRFKAAKTESTNPIELYEIKLWQTDKVDTKYISTYYAITEKEDFPDEYEFRFIRVDADIHAVSISAYDCHGSSSNNILYNKGLYFVDIRSNVPGNANITAYRPGENVRIKITPPSGYRIESISAEGVELDDSMSFVMPENNVIVNVTYSKR